MTFIIFAISGVLIRFGGGIVDKSRNSAIRGAIYGSSRLIVILISMLITIQSFELLGLLLDTFSGLIRDLLPVRDQQNNRVGYELSNQGDCVAALEAD